MVGIRLEMKKFENLPLDTIEPILVSDKSRNLLFNFEEKIQISKEQH